MVGDLQLGQVRQLAPVAQHDLHVAPHRTRPAAAVPAATQLAPPPAHTHRCCYGVNFGVDLGTAAPDWFSSCSAACSIACTTPCTTPSHCHCCCLLGVNVSGQGSGALGSRSNLSSGCRGPGVSSTRFRVRGPGVQFSSVQGSGALGFRAAQFRGQGPWGSVQVSSGFRGPGVQLS